MDGFTTSKLKTTKEQSRLINPRCKLASTNDPEHISKFIDNKLKSGFTFSNCVEEEMPEYHMNKKEIFQKECVVKEIVKTNKNDNKKIIEEMKKATLQLQECLNVMIAEYDKKELTMGTVEKIKKELETQKSLKAELDMLINAAEKEQNSQQ